MGLFDWLRRSGEDQFAQAVMDGIRSAAPGLHVEYNKDDFQLLITTSEGDTGVANLRNVYVHHNGLEKSERPQHISNVVRGFLSQQKPMPEEFEDAQYDLLPVIRNRTHFEFTSLQAELEGSAEFHWPYQDIGEHLGLGLVYDLPEAMRGITHDNLEQWGVSFYEALEVARRNLEQREASVALAGDNLYIAATGDSYDATRLILMDRIRQLEVDGDYIAMVPNRETLLVTGSNDHDGLRMMIEFGRKTFQEASHPMVANAFRLESDEWIPWLPGSGAPMHREFNEASLNSIAADYHDQKQLLDELHEKREIDEFVASFSAVEIDRKLLSYCVWSEHVVSQLPNTDEVMFFSPQSADSDEGEIVARAPWQRVVEVVGDLMQPLDRYPARYRVADFPTREQLKAIGMQE